MNQLALLEHVKNRDDWREGGQQACAGLSSLKNGAPTCHGLSMCLSLRGVQGQEHCTALTS